MKVVLAFNPEKTATLTWQGDFPVVTKCVHCGKESKLAFVAHEFDEERGEDVKETYVSQLYPNDKGYWPHDACCVAVYFCPECVQPTALFNQA